MTGRYIRLPFHGTEGHKTIGNCYTTLLNAHGNPIKHYGDLDLENVPPEARPDRLHQGVHQLIRHTSHQQRKRARTATVSRSG